MELKPCPFCGQSGIQHNGEENAWIGCSDPLCEAYTIDMSVDEWNTRQPSEIEKAARELIKYTEEYYDVQSDCVRCLFCGKNIGEHHVHKESCPWLRLKRACEEEK